MIMMEDMSVRLGMVDFQLSDAAAAFGLSCPRRLGQLQSGCWEAVLDFS
jgi:hypothetical protein